MASSALHLAAEKQARAICVFVHGRGQSPEEMQSHVLARLDAPDVAFVLPRAESGSWYDARAIDPLTAGTRTALQAALDCAAELGGAAVEVGLGRFRVDGALTVPQDVSLEGLGRGMGGDHVWGRDTWRPGDPELFRSVGNKSVLLAYGGRGEADGAPLISMEANSVVTGLTVLYPEQRPLEEPVAYPFAVDLCSRARREACRAAPAAAVQGGGPGGTCCSNNMVSDLELVNAYQGVRAQMAPRFFLQRIFGQCLFRGVVAEYTFDISRVNDVHFYTYWSSAEPVLTFMRRQGVGFTFGRNDWLQVTRTYAWSMHEAYLFRESPELPPASEGGAGVGGGCANGEFTNLSADFSVQAVRLECTSPTGVQIVGGEFTAFQNPSHNGTTEETPVHVASTPGHEGVVKFSGCNFWGPGAFPGSVLPPEHGVADLRGAPLETVSFDGCTFMQFNNTDSPASPYLLELAGRGSYSVQGSTFWTSQPARHVRVGPQVGMALVANNLFSSGPLVTDEVGDPAAVALSGNVRFRGGTPGPAAGGGAPRTGGTRGSGSASSRAFRLPRGAPASSDAAERSLRRPSAGRGGAAGLNEIHNEEARWPPVPA